MQACRDKERDAVACSMIAVTAAHAIGTVSSAFVIAKIQTPALSRANVPHSLLCFFNMNREG